MSESIMEHLSNVVLTFESVYEIYGVTIQMKPLQ